MRIQTPKTWPEATMPTPEQWRDWFLACTPEEQQQLAAKVLDDNERSIRCLVSDHDEAITQLQRAGNALIRYRLAWLSARRRGVALRRIQSAVDDYLARTATREHE